MPGESMETGDDIVSAAEEARTAPTSKPERPTSPADPETEGGTAADPGTEEGAPETTPEDERAAIAKERAELAYERRLLDERKKWEAERDAEKPEKRDASSQAIDPVKDPFQWRYARGNQYREHWSAQGATFTEEHVRDAVERDLEKAQFRVNADRVRELQEKLEETEKERAQEKEAKTIAAQVEPLYKKYPGADTDDGREEVEARLFRAAQLGQPFDPEAVIRKVHLRTKQAPADAVRDYVGKKQAIAAATRPTALRGGQPLGQKPSRLQKVMGNGDFDSITEVGEMLAKGEVGKR